jgi:hypothetical protein
VGCLRVCVRCKVKCNGCDPPEILVGRQRVCRLCVCVCGWVFVGCLRVCVRCKMTMHQNSCRLPLHAFYACMCVRAYENYLCVHASLLSILLALPHSLTHSLTHSLPLFVCVCVRARVYTYINTCTPTSIFSRSCSRSRSRSCSRSRSLCCVSLS